MRRAALLLLLALTAAAPAAARAGEVGSTLGKYSMAGAGVGALLGTASATLPYLQSKQPYDFAAGAGVGLLAGVGVGFILGIVDLASVGDEQAALRPPDGFALAFQPAAVRASWTLSF